MMMDKLSRFLYLSLVAGAILYLLSGCGPTRPIPMSPLSQPLTLPGLFSISREACILIHLDQSIGMQVKSQDSQLVESMLEGLNHGRGVPDLDEPYKALSPEIRTALILPINLCRRRATLLPEDPQGAYREGLVEVLHGCQDGLVGNP